jgi:hypothetical protein
MKYKRVKAGEWIYPVQKGYKLRCCDCGLVHRLNFRAVKDGKRHSVKFQAFRDERATAACRRKRGT